MTFLSGYNKRKAVKYGTAFPGSNLTDFPKLIRITTDSDIASELSGGGGIAFTQADGTTTCPFGLYPDCTPSAGTFLLRVKFPTLLTAASTGDVLGYIYYDHTQTTSQSKSSVMDGNYVAFMPLEEDPSGGAPQMLDWVTNTNIGTSNGSMTSGDLVAAEVGDGLDFDGSDDYIACGNLSAGSDKTATYEVICKTSSTNDANWLISEGNSGDGTPISGMRFDPGSSGKVEGFIRDNGGGLILYGSPGASVADSNFHAIAAKLNSTAATMYRDGVAGTPVDISGVGAITLNVSAIACLLRTGTGNFLTAILDEVRISSVARSSDWLAWAYTDDFATSSTFSLGTQEVGADVFTASGAFTAAHATFAASATFSPGTHTATGSLTVAHATFAASATFVAPTYHGAAAMTAKGATMAASATFTSPVYTATASLTAAHATFAGSAIFATAVYQATATLTVAHATFAGSATFTVPTYTGTATLTTGAATFAGVATTAGSTILVWGDRVHETGTATGLGNVTLAGRAFNKRSFASVLNTNDYAIVMIASQTTDQMWEFTPVQMQGDGTLARGTPYSSSAGGASVAFDGSVCDVFIDTPLEIVYTAFSVAGFSPVVR